MSRLTVRQWRKLVFASRDERMSSAVKVLCLYLADHMGERDRKVSVPRERIAVALGVHKARVAERLTKAVEAGFLSRVSTGYRGSTAVYQATRPAAECVQQSGNQSDRMGTAPPDALSTRRTVTIPGDAERESRGMRTAPLDANIEADLSVSPTAGNVGNDEKAADNPARFDPPVCACHDLPGCISPLPSYREESA